jgi:predicted O-methyltransferase YrrM
MHIDLDKLWNTAIEKKIQQIRIEWEWLIKSITNNKECPINILEIGCYDGGSSWYLNNFASNMITIDNNIPCRFDPNILGKNYQYIGGDSHDPSMTEFFKKQDWDFVFIDGDHSYEGVKADFYNILPFLKKNTMVAFHDIVISDFHHTHGCYVGEFWRDLKKEYNASSFDEIITDKEWGGIGIVWI